MRRITLLALCAALLTTAAWAVRSAAGGSDQTTAAAPANAEAAHYHPMTPSSGAIAYEHTAAGRGLAAQLVQARLATARYATDLRAAKADGCQVITRMMPDMGWHFLNPAVQGFDVRKPPILVYERHGKTWQLGALEWVFPEKPATPPLPGATYGSFGAA